MNFQWMTEVIDECKTEKEAKEVLDFLRSQTDFVCGRVLAKGGGKPWRAQAFFPDVTPAVAAVLPDGVNRRLVPESVLTTCGKR